MSDEYFAAFMMVWQGAMADMVRAARNGDIEARNRFKTVIDALIDAYPNLADMAMDPKARS